MQTWIHLVLIVTKAFTRIFCITIRARPQGTRLTRDFFHLAPAAAGIRKALELDIRLPSPKEKGTAKVGIWDPCNPRQRDYSPLIFS
jgi:hypothetical protein